MPPGYLIVILSALCKKYTIRSFNKLCNNVEKTSPLLFNIILDPCSQRAGSYKSGAVIVNV